MKHHIRQIFLSLVLFSFILYIVCMAFLSFRQNRGTGTLLLNEICTSNVASLSGNSGRYPDWAELYNPTDRDIDLSGYRLSRRKELSGGWQLPSATVPAGGYYLVYLDSEAPDENTADFSLSSGGATLCLSFRDGQAADQVTIPALLHDTVWGRKSDGGREWARLIPTPGSSNAGAKEAPYPIDASVAFSAPGGFYPEQFELTLTTERDCRICYTLDGSEPDRDSVLYDSPIKITSLAGAEDLSGSGEENSVREDISIGYEKGIYSAPVNPVDRAVVVRARACDREGRLGRTFTNTYFIGYDGRASYEGMPALSLVSDPVHLFSKEQGIFVLGQVYEDYLRSGEENPNWWWTPGNYSLRGRESERSANISYFNEEHRLLFSTEAGIRIKGAGTRGLAQKSINLFARPAYGRETFPGIFPWDGANTEHDALTLFSGGDDIVMKLKDLLTARLLKDHETMAADGRPCSLFLNGEYWGVYWLMEKFGASFLKNHFDVEEDNLVLIKNDEAAVGESSDKALYDDLNRYVTHHDFADPEVYRHFQEMVDLDSLLDYYCVQIYIEHVNDWPGNNVALWRVRTPRSTLPYSDGKWRYLIFDVNSVSMEASQVDHATMSLTVGKNYMLKALMASPEFRSDFLERFEELSETVFDPDHVEEVIDGLASSIRPQIELTCDRFYGRKKTVEDFDRQVEDLRFFFRNRYPYIIEDVKNCCAYE